MSFHVLLVAITMQTANLITFFGLSPFRHATLLPLTFLLFGVTVVGTTISVRFIKLAPIDLVLSKLGSLFGDLVPLARDIVIEEIDSGVVVLDEDNYIVDVNAMGRRILAPQGDRVVGKQLTEVVPEELFVSEKTELLEPGVTGRFESVWVEALDGTERCYDVSFTELKATESDDTGSRVGLIHDVTEKQRRKRKLEAKNEQLDSFASMVSHDLRNPLNVAEGYVETIQAHVDEDDPVATYAKEINISHERMEEIIEDVLILAREGKTVDEMHLLELKELATTAWGNVETEDAKFVSRIEQDVSIEANRSSLLRVFENLIRNAIEHGLDDSDSDDRVVRVGTLPEERGFYLEDTGAGIPQERRDEVFEQGHTTNTDGTGFGLSIAQDIADAHGWKITITESEEGGARFEFDDVDHDVSASETTDTPANT
jgi:PAS domain S-box-containing protein